jgi:hypothetical protein
VAQVPGLEIDLAGPIAFELIKACRLEQRPEIGPAVAASPAGKLGLEIRQLDIIGPAMSLDHDGMRALVIAAINDEPGRAGLPHFSEVIFRSRNSS